MTRKMMLLGWGLMLMLAAVTAFGWSYECQLDATNTSSWSQIGDSWDPGSGLRAVNSWISTETYDADADYEIQILPNEGPAIYRHHGGIPSEDQVYIKFQSFPNNLLGYTCTFELDNAGDAIVKEGMQYPVAL